MRSEMSRKDKAIFRHRQRAFKNQVLQLNILRNGLRTTLSPSHLSPLNRVIAPFYMNFSALLRTLLLAGSLLLTLTVRAERLVFLLRNFDRFEVSNEFVVEIKPGDGYRVVVVGAPRDLKNIEAGFVRSSSTAFVRFRRDYLNPSKMRVRLTVTLPTLRGLSLGGKSKTGLEGFKNLDAFDLKLSGEAKAKLQFKAQKVTLTAGGGSELTIIGETTDFTGTVFGGSEVRGYNFEVRNARLSLSGASSVHALVSKSLVAEASGGSTLLYRGGARLRSSTSGGSTVRNE